MFEQKRINNLIIYKKRSKEVYNVMIANRKILFRTPSLEYATLWCTNCTDYITRGKKDVLSLYHGSCDKVGQPCFESGEHTNEFGLGFYCVVNMDNLELAKEYACTPYNSGEGYLNSYKLDISNMKILNLGKFDIIYWITLVAVNKVVNIDEDILNILKSKYLINIDEYDCIYGYRCDDNFSIIIDGFLSERFSAEAIMEAMSLDYIQRQFVLKSKKAFDTIKFVSSRKISNFNEQQKNFIDRMSNVEKVIMECQRRHTDGKYLSDYLRGSVEWRIST